MADIVHTCVHCVHTLVLQQQKPFTFNTQEHMYTCQNNIHIVSCQ